MAVLVKENIEKTADGNVVVPFTGGWHSQTGGGSCMENLYENARGLEKALRQSDEYVNLKKLFYAVNNDESARNLFENFRNIQMRLQEKQMMGQNISEEEVIQAQKAAALVQQNGKIAQLMDAEQRMSTVINELNKIIMKPLDELYGPFNG